MVNKLKLNKLPSLCMFGAIAVILGVLVSVSIVAGCGGSDATPIVEYTLTIHLDTTMPVNENTLVDVGIL